MHGSEPQLIFGCNRIEIGRLMALQQVEKQS
jgi:hypothetical protein